jgi:DNA polymerase-1
MRQAETIPPGYAAITDIQTLRVWCEAARRQGFLAFDTETTSLDPQVATLVGFSIALAPGTSAYVPLAHTAGFPQIDLDSALNELAPVLANPLITKITQNGKYDIGVMARYGVPILNVEDTMLESYAMNSGKHYHGMDALAKIYLNHTTISYSEVTGKGSRKLSFDEVELEPATDYAAEDSDITLQLHLNFQARMDEQERRTYEQIDRPLIHVLADMERAGVRIDEAHLNAFAAQLRERAETALAAAQETAGVRFNPASPDQVGEVLFNHLGLPTVARTETGKPATGVDVLEKIQDRTDISEQAQATIKHILEFRRVQKLRSTYAEALVAAVNPITGRVHPSFQQTGAVTGRLSCSDPNLQNIPIRTADGKLIRRAFIAAPGHKLIAADYSQIELRIVAHAAREQAMMRAFEEGIDIHRMTAAEVNCCPVEDVTSDMRRDAKAVNFGIIYGISGFGLARDLKITPDEGAAIIGRYLDRFPGIRDYMAMARAFAKDHGYVETLTGRKIWLPDIEHRWGSKRSHAERLAINAPIQGSAADIMKYAMIDVAEMLRVQKSRTRMLLQVHDELIFESPDDEAEQIMPEIQKIMETAYALDVPLVVDAKAADNWLAAH